MANWSACAAYLVSLVMASLLRFSSSLNIYAMQRAGILRVEQGEVVLLGLSASP